MILQLNLHDILIFLAFKLQAFKLQAQVHPEVTPLIPRSSAIMTAAFSPIAIAVL